MCKQCRGGRGEESVYNQLVRKYMLENQYVSNAGGGLERKKCLLQLEYGFAVSCAGVRRCSAGLKIRYFSSKK